VMLRVCLAALAATPQSVQQSLHAQRPHGPVASSSGVELSAAPAPAGEILASMANSSQEAVGRAIAAAGTPRARVFSTSKFNPHNSITQSTHESAADQMTMTLGQLKRPAAYAPATLQPHVQQLGQDLEWCTGPARRALMHGHADALLDNNTRAALGRCMTMRLSRQHSMLFLHVSKSGGTSMCNTVLQEGCRAPPSTCELGPDGLAWFESLTSSPRDWSETWSCKQREEWTRKSASTFSAIERPLIKEVLKDGGLDPECTQRFMTSLFLRRPLDRIESHYAELLGPFWTRQRPKGLQPLQSHEDTSTGQNTTTYNVPYFVRMAPIVSDNYYTRMLGGQEAFEAPFGMLNETHAARAMRTLRLFDWILDLDAPTNETNFTLHRGMGLSHDLEHSKLHATPSSVNATLSDMDRRWLDALNVYDKRLYGEGQALQQLDVRSLQLLQGHYPSPVAGTGAQHDSSDSPTPRTEPCCGFSCH